MKTLRNSLTAFAFVFAIGGAFASMFVQQGWYDSNGATAGGGVQAAITNPAGDTPVCRVQTTGVICTITNISGTFNAYSTQAAAESANPALLLKHN